MKVRGLFVLYVVVYNLNRQYFYETEIKVFKIRYGKRSNSYEVQYVHSGYIFLHISSEKCKSIDGIPEVFSVLINYIFLKDKHP